MDYEVDSPEDLAKIFLTKRELGLKGGAVVANPIPEKYSMDKAVIDKVIAEAIDEADAKGIHGKETTPFLLAKIAEITGNDSLEANIELVFNNVALGAKTAVALSNLEK